MTDRPKIGAIDGGSITCLECGRKKRLSCDMRMRPPAGWYIVRFRAPAGAASERAFCSRDCLAVAHRTIPARES